MSNRILVSFQHPVAAVIDRHVLLINCAVCQEIFQSVVSTTPKDLTNTAPEVAEAHPAELMGQLNDFPLLLRILTLADGIELSPCPELILKWSNVSAICNLSDEQWTAMRKPPRKSRRKSAQ